MATKPDEPPESIIWSQALGIRNTVSRERLNLGELESAVNIDIDDVGQAHRRRGFTQVDTSAYHSLYDGDRKLVVKNGHLGELAADYSFTSIVFVGDQELSYTNVGDTIFYASAAVSGKILSDNTQLPWGYTGGDGTWLSPVITPTDTLGAISGKMLHAPPTATDIEAFNGRIYLAAGNVVWATELFLFDYVDRDRNYMQFEFPVTMLASVEDGLYVGTEQSFHFLSGTLAEGMTMRDLSNSGIIRGSVTRAPADKVHPAARQGGVPVTKAIICLATDGVYALFKSGEVYNLTQDKVVFPAAVNSAALFREQDGVNSYVAVADSAGTPAAKARIGDFVDAEIVRFQGG